MTEAASTEQDTLLRRRVALIAVIAGSVSATGLFLRAAQRNGSTPPLLVALFVLWVLSPFVVLVLAYGLSKRWSAGTRSRLYGVMLTVTLGTLAVYGVVALGPPMARPAPVFVLVPPVSWLVTAIAVGTAALRSRRR